MYRRLILLPRASILKSLLTGSRERRKHVAYVPHVVKWWRTGINNRATDPVSISRKIKDTNMENIERKVVSRGKIKVKRVRVEQDLIHFPVGSSLRIGISLRRTRV